RKNQDKKVLDLSCGTGSQVFYLAKRGYKVTGVDISPGMLKIAKKLAKDGKIKVRILKGDMCVSKIGKFDAVVTIFNAVGHLTKKGFEKAMVNIRSNLKDGGLYIFDIFNLDYDKNKKMEMDLTRNFGNIKIRKVQHCRLDRKAGILWCNDRFIVQEGRSKPETFKGRFPLQIYTSEEVKEMLSRNGFEVLGQYGIDGSEFSKKGTERIMTIAKKR
ncbi:MAG: class I SAM-dependent methyltransferase, partial [Candidatus Pacebacteria bacterium]|nr:class I SAM-dependent methyltransferase [Candidatus Paceibacterota bacterium]